MIKQMTIDIDETKVKRNEFGLWLAWTLATALGMLIGYLPLALLVGSLDLGVARIIVPIIAGALLGLAQWLVLRPYVSKSYDWILNQAVGWMVGFTLGLFVVQLLSKTPLVIEMAWIRWRTDSTISMISLMDLRLPQIFGTEQYRHVKMQLPVTVINA